MDNFTRGKRRSLSAIRTDIRGRLDAAKFTEERMTALDIKAQQLRAQAAIALFMHYEQIEAACQRRGITVGNWCKNELGYGLTHLRKLRQLRFTNAGVTTPRGARAMTAIVMGCDLRLPWSASRPMVNRAPPLWAIKTIPIEMSPASQSVAFG